MSNTGILNLVQRALDEQGRTDVQIVKCDDDRTRGIGRREPRIPEPRAMNEKDIRAFNKAAFERRRIDQDKVREIVTNVRTGVRTKAELRECGCPECREALVRLKRRE